MRSSRLVDFVCILLAASVVGLAWKGRHEHRAILLLDQPRTESDGGDFISHFLNATQTPHAFEEGFVSLESNPEVRRRLLQLLAGLHICLSVNEENSRRIEDGKSMLTCVATTDGTVKVLPSGAEKDSRERLDQERKALIEQCQTVASAIQTLPKDEPAISFSLWDWLATPGESPTTSELSETIASTEPDPAPAPPEDVAAPAGVAPAPAPVAPAKTKESTPPPSDPMPENQNIELTEIESLPPK